MENNPFIVDLPINNGDFPVVLVYEKEFHIETKNSIKQLYRFH